MSFNGKKGKIRQRYDQKNDSQTFFIKKYAFRKPIWRDTCTNSKKQKYYILMDKYFWEHLLCKNRIYPDNNCDIYNSFHKFPMKANVANNLTQ